MHRQTDSHYAHETYFGPHRFASWGIQFEEALATGAERFLEVGKGTGVLAYALSKVGKTVLTVDPDPALVPDVIAALPDLPVATESVDAVLCFEVLEHLPFETFRECMQEMSRISRKWVVLSIPNRIPLLRFMVDGPGLHFSRAWPRPRKIPNDPLFEDHCWEIGAGVAEKDVQEQIQGTGLDICRSFRPWAWPYHHFFVCRKAE